MSIPPRKANSTGAQSRGSSQDGSRSSDVLFSSRTSAAFSDVGVEAKDKEKMSVEELEKIVKDSEESGNYEYFIDKAQARYMASPLLVEKQYCGIVNEIKLNPYKYFEHKPGEATNKDNLDAEELEKVFDARRITRLVAERTEDNTMYIPPDVKNLHTLNVQRKALQVRDSRKYVKYCENLQHLMFNNAFSSQCHVKGEKSVLDPDMVIPNTVLRVEFYRPHVIPRANIKLAKSPQVVAEYLVLGSETLSDLKSKLICEEDYSHPAKKISKGDKYNSGWFDDSNNLVCRDLFPSSYFYVNGTLYDDMEDAASTGKTKLSESVVQFLSEHQIATVKSALMHTTKFRDLIIDLGLPYLYVHHGDCEHLIVFTEIRQLTASDCLQLSEYPIVSRLVTKGANTVTCIMCQRNTLYDILLVTSVHPSKVATPETEAYCHSCFHKIFFNDDDCAVQDFSFQPHIDFTCAAADTLKIPPLQLD